MTIIFRPSSRIFFFLHTSNINHRDTSLLNNSTTTQSDTNQQLNIFITCNQDGSTNWLSRPKSFSHVDFVDNFLSAIPHSTRGRRQTLLLARHHHSRRIRRACQLRNPTSYSEQGRQGRFRLLRTDRQTRQKEICQGEPLSSSISISSNYEGTHIGNSNNANLKSRDPPTHVLQTKRLQRYSDVQRCQRSHDSGFLALVQATTPSR